MKDLESYDHSVPYKASLVTSGMYIYQRIGNFYIRHDYFTSQNITQALTSF